METRTGLDAVYKPSDDVVAREVQGEFVIIPIASGIGDAEDEIFTLNETGRAVWNRLDGIKNLKEVQRDLAQEYDAPEADMARDLLGITEELLKRKMLVHAG
jgi:hypothetical protein